MLIFLLIFILLALVLACLYCYYTCFCSPADRREDPYALLHGRQYKEVAEHIFHCTRLMEEAPCEFVTVRAWDGTQLSARYYHNKDGAPVQILFHGYRSLALRDCAGGYILANKLGFNVLAVDQRAHSRSGGRTIAFGIKERKDCLDWVRYVLRRFGADTQVILSGLSMGAATVLMAAELELPENVRCIMADCPYSAPAAIIRKVCVDRKIPDRLAYPFIRLSARVIGRFDLEECNARDAVKHAKVPVLLLHGEDDRFVPCEMSREITKSCASRCDLHTFPGAGHGLCYITDPVKYERVTVAFLNSIPILREYLSGISYAQQTLANAENVDFQQTFDKRA